MESTFPGTQPPSFTVDLSVAPDHRYDHIAHEVFNHVSKQELAELFNDLVAVLGPRLERLIHRLARLFLRRVYTDEESAELKGISRLTQLPIHLLVAFNVLLDLLLGCTSGGVRAKDDEDAAAQISGSVPASMRLRPIRSRILHFRTLDWSMPPLRKLVVELNFVRATGGPVVASTIGYFGYVGVLTGVRQGLSVSLNHRGHHYRGGLSSRASFRWHQAMVVLGHRPSISSTLRHILLSQPGDEPMIRRRRPRRRELRRKHRDHHKTYEAGESKPAEHQDADEFGNDQDLPHAAFESLVHEFLAIKSTAAYIVLCTPQRVYGLEKDNGFGSMRCNDSFLVMCNHDFVDEPSGSKQGRLEKVLGAGNNALRDPEIQAFLDQSVGRSAQARQIWRKSLRARRYLLGRECDSVLFGIVLRILGDPLITHEMTHYVAVMDPQLGRVVWKRALAVDELRPVEEKWVVALNTCMDGDPESVSLRLSLEQHASNR